MEKFKQIILYLLNAEAQKSRGAEKTCRPSAPLRLCASVLTLLFLISTGSIHAQPWGKDADLALSCPEHCNPMPTCRTPLIGHVGEALIKFHQNVISPADGPRSNFKPSSSQYALDAMRKYGFFRGFIMGCDRLMRENDDPWVYKTVKIGPNIIMKHNPVP